MASSADRRSKGRLGCDGLRTALGEVVDVSASGMRVRRQGRGGVTAGDTYSFVLENEGVACRVTCRVARVRRVGLFRHEIGLEFVELTEEVARRVAQLAIDARVQYSSVA